MAGRRTVMIVVLSSLLAAGWTGSGQEVPAPKDGGAAAPLSGGPGREVIHYGFGSPVTLPEMANAGVTVLAIVPYEKELCDQANAYGIKILPYISISRVFNSPNEPLIQRHPFWREVDASRHPEWFCINKDGKVHRYWGQKNYRLHAAFDAVCQNHSNYIEAAGRGVDNLMKQGCGGVFIDENSYSPYYGYCWGDKLGIHRHEWPVDDPAQSARESFFKTMRKIQDTVKKYGGDKLIIRNGSLPNVKLGDYTMLESFSYNLFYVPPESPGKPVLQVRQNLRPSITYSTRYPDFVKKYADYDKIQTESNLFSALTYIPEPCSADEYPFVAYAYAKLIGLPSWSATCFYNCGDYFGNLNRNDIVRRLYRACDLGKKRTGPLMKDRYAYIVFEKGIVVLNPSPEKIRVNLPVADFMDENLAELRTGTRVAGKNGCAEMLLEPDSACIIQPKTDVLNNYLREIKGALTAIEKYAEDNLTRFKNPKFTRNDMIREIAGCQAEVDRLLAARGKFDIADIDRLSHRLSKLESDKIVTEVLPIFKQKYADLKSADLKRLLAMPGAGISEASLFQGAVKKAVLRTGGMTFIIPSYGLGNLNSYLLQCSGDAYLNLASGPIYMASSSARETLAFPENNCLVLKIKTGGREYLLNQFESLQMVVDTPDKKRIEGIAALRRADTAVPVSEFCTVGDLLSMPEKWRAYADKELNLKVVIEIESGSPFISLQLTLMKNKSPVNGTISLFPTGNVQQISPDTGLTSSLSRNTRAEWVCCLSNPEAVTGNVFIGDGEELNIQGGKIVSPENGRLRVYFTHVRMDQSFFVEERLRNCKLNMGLIMQIMHGVRLSFESPTAAARTEAVPVTISLEQSGTGNSIAAIKPFISAELVFTTSRSGPKKQGQRPVQNITGSDGKYSIHIGEDAAFNDILAVKYGVDVSLENGTGYRIENFKWIRIGEKNEYLKATPASVKSEDPGFKENADL